MTYAIRSVLADFLRWLAAKVDPEKWNGQGMFVGSAVNSYMDDDDLKPGGTD